MEGSLDLGPFPVLLLGGGHECALGRGAGVLVAGVVGGVGGAGGRGSRKEKGGEREIRDARTVEARLGKCGGREDEEEEGRRKGIREGGRWGERESDD